MIRLTLLLMCLPTWAAAWEFSPDPLCTLSHQSQTAEVVITHDPSVPVYRMRVSLVGDRWADSQTFGIAFRGGRSLTIGTDRHLIDNDTLSVADSGFGNVLDGLEYNLVAIAFTKSQSLQLSLDGAAPEVRKFRDCALQAPALS